MNIVVNDNTHKTLLTKCLKLYYNWVVENIQQPVRNTLGIIPSPLAGFLKKVTDLSHQFPNSSSNGIPLSVKVDEIDLPYIKRAILHTVYTRSVHVERQVALTNDRIIKEGFEQEISNLYNLMEVDWFDSVKPIVTPKLTDYLTLQQALTSNKAHISKRQFDEKFHILNSPAQFPEDINYYRTECSIRSKPISLVFIDIDDFKKFNSDHGETKVDRDVLPKLMSEFEAHTFSHGHAYRFGGDEYVLLLSNTSSDRASALVFDMQDSLSKIEYFGISDRPTVSIGIMEISADCALTNNQCLAMAEKAKGRAKEDANKGNIYVNIGSKPSENSYKKFNN